MARIYFQLLCWTLFRVGFVSSLASDSSSYPTLTPVQETSLLVAYWRHLETTTGQGLIQDDPASALIQALLPEDRIRSFRESPICNCGQDILAVRTRCIDDWLLLDDLWRDLPDQNQQPKKRQLVNLGAGMCARHCRLGQSLANRYDRMWEVDSDVKLLKIKSEVLGSSGREEPPREGILPLEHLQGDLASANSLARLETKLLSSSFDLSKPTDFILEGVLEYIDPAQHPVILEFANRIAAPGSRMALQVLEEPLRDYFASLGVEGLPWQDLPPLSTFSKCASTFGWDVERVIQPHEWATIYDRDLSNNAPGFNMVFLTKNQEGDKLTN